MNVAGFADKKNDTQISDAGKYWIRVAQYVVRSTNFFNLYQVLSRSDGVVMVTASINIHTSK